jgi:hypothetical protein
MKIRTGIKNLLEVMNGSQRAVSESVSACGSLDSIRIQASQLDRCLPGKQKQVIWGKGPSWLAGGVELNFYLTDENSAGGARGAGQHAPSTPPPARGLADSNQAIGWPQITIGG